MRLSLMFIVLLTASGVSAAFTYQAQVQPVTTPSAETSTEAEPFQAQSPEPEPALSSPPTGAIYRWVDAQGQVHYSDRPLANAQTVTVNPVVTEFARTPVAASSQAVVAGNGATADSERTVTLIQAPAVSVSFIEPTDEQSIRANDGNLRVRWQAQAERLTSGLLFLLRHNDRVVYQGEAPVYDFENLDRGAHQLQVQAVVNDNGRAGDLLAESEIITVYILRASVLNPNSPLNRTNLVQK